MDSVYVVEVEVNGFAVEGMIGTDGVPLTEREANKANKAKRTAVENLDVDLVEILQRDDGSGIFYFEWDPPAEGWTREDPTASAKDRSAALGGRRIDAERHFDAEPVDGAAQTWHSAKLYTEHVASSVVGAGFQLVESRIVTRDREDAPPAA